MASYTVDASVFLSAFIPTEPGHEECRLALELLREGPHALVEPPQVLAEVASAIARNLEDPELAESFAYTLAKLPKLVWVPMDLDLAHRAAEAAARHRLKGSDAIYAAVAKRFGSTLVTMDREQLGQTTGAIQTCTPTELLTLETC